MNILKKLNIMTPEGKAKELVEQFMPHTDWYVFEADQVNGKPTCSELQTENAKQCSLIAADKVLAFIGEENWSDPSLDYWQQVKAEIEKL